MISLIEKWFRFSQNHSSINLVGNLTWEGDRSTLIFCLNDFICAPFSKFKTRNNQQTMRLYSSHIQETSHLPWSNSMLSHNHLKLCTKLLFLQGFGMTDPVGTIPVYLPIHEWLVFMVNIGKYNSPMHPSWEWETWEKCLVVFFFPFLLFHAFLQNSKLRPDRYTHFFFRPSWCSKGIFLEKWSESPRLYKSDGKILLFLLAPTGAPPWKTLRAFKKKNPRGHKSLKDTPLPN